ncbi:MAG TPA: DUF6529 family protein [Jatrophihabitans sp.]|jgi:hypothetical protein|nr:DUF6529 family protein [Jatrophihabitans sp.]
MATVVESPRARLAVAGALLAGCAVAVALGVYGREHGLGAKPLFFNLTDLLRAKTWFATAALVFVLLQLTSALWMWGRLPGVRTVPGWMGLVHRWSGAVAFVLLIPVALNCLWSLGFVTTTTRALVHSVAGCVFYGAYTAKMLGLRLRNSPGWLLPVLGGLVFAAFITLWLTSALWYFRNFGAT